MKQKDIYGDFYNPTKILSYGKPMNISVGSRSIGKSTSFGIHLLKDFLKNKHQFIYVRRTEIELRNAAPFAFSNAIQIINQYHYKLLIEDFRYEKNTYYIGEQACGYAIPLSQVEKFKSIPFNDVYWILYDEFIPKQGTRMLGSKDEPFLEYQLLMNLIISCDREVGKAYANRVRTILVANAKGYFSPILQKLHCDRYLTPATKICAPKDMNWVVEQTVSVDATKDFENSNSYKLSDEDERNYSFEAGINNDKRFIEKKPTEKINPLCNLIYKNDIMGMYYGATTGKIYINYNKIKEGKTLALTVDDHDINYLLAEKKDFYIVLLKRSYQYGMVRFQTGKIKMQILTYLMLTSKG